MAEVSIIGIDLAKRIFQAHGADASGKKLFSEKLTRNRVLSFLRSHKPCIVAMEACSAAHYWGRQITALGHTVRLIPPQYVKPFVKRGKNDAADAEAICEAAVRPNMKFVSLRTEEQHASAMLFRFRDQLVRQETQLINAVRGHCAEFGIVAPQGTKGFESLKTLIDDAKELPALAKKLLKTMLEHIEEKQKEIAGLNKDMEKQVKTDPVAKRLMSVPGVGPVTALAIRTLGADAASFKSGRDYAAWMGLVPSQHSSGGKERLGRITRKGNRTLRRLLVIGANAVVTSVGRERTVPGPWLKNMIERRPAMLAITALANKIARIVWALQVRGGVYKAPKAA